MKWSSWKVAEGEFYIKSHSSYPEALSSLQVTNRFGFAVGISKYSNENCKVETHFVKKGSCSLANRACRSFYNKESHRNKKRQKPPKAPEEILFEFGKIFLKISMF